MTIENCWTYFVKNYCSYLFFEFRYSQVNKSWFICYRERHDGILFFPIWSDLPGRHKQYALFTTAQTAPSAPEKHCKAYNSPATVVVSTPPKNTHAVISAFSLESVLNSKCKVTPKWNLARKLSINLTASTKNKEAYYTVCSWHTLAIQMATGSMLRHSQGNSCLHSTVSQKHQLRDHHCISPECPFCSTFCLIRVQNILVESVLNTDNNQSYKLWKAYIPYT